MYLARAEELRELQPLWMPPSERSSRAGKAERSFPTSDQTMWPEVITNGILE